MEKLQKVVILGGGFGGVRVALDLAKKKDPNLQITLLDQTAFHEYHADMYEIAATFLPEDGSKRQKKLRFEHLRGTVAVAYEEIFRRTNVEVKVATVGHINLKEKLLLTEKEKIDYDILVIASGSVTNFFDIPNLEKKSLPLKTVGDALNIRDEIDELFLRKKRNEEIRIVVGGGGLTGCELTGELSAYIQKLAHLHSHSLDKINLSIVEACPSLLNGTEIWFQKETEKRLKDLGAEIFLNSKIDDVVKEQVLLGDGRKLDFDILVWTAGIKANPLVAEIAGVSLEKNCLAIHKNLLLVGTENVFAIGDNVYCYDYRHACVVPPTAQLAIAQGHLAAENILRLMEGRNLKDFEPTPPNFVVPLGPKFALAKVDGIKLKGIVAWWAKRLIALRYFASILPFSKAWQLWASGNRFFLENAAVES